MANEVGVLRRLDHPNIVRLVDSFAESSDLCLLLEYVDGGELFDRIAEMDPGHFGERDTRDICYQLMDALAFMHARGIVHRDLKPENILTTLGPGASSSPSAAMSSSTTSLASVNSSSPGYGSSRPNKDVMIPFPYPHTPSLVVKISDFGVSKLLRHGPTSSRGLMGTICGTYPYMAPEIMSRSMGAVEGYGYGCDVWSVGVIAYVLMTNKFPYKIVPDGVTEGPACTSTPEQEQHGKDAATAAVVEEHSISVALLHERILERPWKKKLADGTHEWTGISEDCRKWVQSCLEVTPKKRAKAAEARESPWFSTILEGDDREEAYRVAEARAALRNKALENSPRPRSLAGFFTRSPSMRGGSPSALSPVSAGSLLAQPSPRLGPGSALSPSLNGSSSPGSGKIIGGASPSLQISPVPSESTSGAASDDGFLSLGDPLVDVKDPVGIGHLGVSGSAVAAPQPKKPASIKSAFKSMFGGKKEKKEKEKTERPGSAPPGNG